METDYDDIRVPDLARGFTYGLLAGAVLWGTVFLLVLTFGVKATFLGLAAGGCLAMARASWRDRK